MFLVFACRRAEPGEPGPKDWPTWHGLYGAFPDRQDAERLEKQLNAKGGFVSVKILEIKEPSSAT